MSSLLASSSPSTSLGTFWVKSHLWFQVSLQCYHTDREPSSKLTSGMDSSVCLLTRVFSPCWLFNHLHCSCLLILVRIISKDAYISQGASRPPSKEGNRRTVPALYVRSSVVLSEFEDQIKIGVLQLGVPSGSLPFLGRMVASVLVLVLAEFCGGY